VFASILALHFPYHPITALHGTLFVIDLCVANSLGYRDEMRSERDSNPRPSTR